MGFADLAREVIKDMGGPGIDNTIEPLSLEHREAFEERAGIMQYDGDLDREEAERQAWCLHACMLSFPSQWRECERFKTKPCSKLSNQKGDHEKDK